MGHGETHYENEEIYDWAKRHWEYENIRKVYGIIYWLDEEVKQREQPKVSWELFCNAVAELANRHTKYEKHDVYQVDGTNRRLKRLLEWTMEIDETLSKLSPTTDIHAWMAAEAAEYPIISAFGLTEMVTSLRESKER